jgi:hypothetical protein
MSIKLVVIILATVAAAICPGQSATYDVYALGKKVGSGSWKQSVLRNGDYSTQLSFELAVGEELFRASGEVVTTRNGMPKRNRMEYSDKGLVLETYGKSSVKVETTQNGRKITKEIKYPPGKSVRSPSFLWFISVKPKVGQSETYYELDTDTYKWQLARDTYVGSRIIKVGGRNRQAHFITSKEIDFWLDSKGIPLRIHIKLDGDVLVLERSTQ